MARKTERLQVPIDIGLRQEIERAAKEADSSCAQIMRQALRANGGCAARSSSRSGKERRDEAV
jgi:hypothetical protein